MTVDAKVQRGEKSWTYIYVVLGFALAIEGTIIQMITPLVFPYNVAVYLLVGVLTSWLMISSGWVQNKLLGLKNSYETRAR